MQSEKKIFGFSKNIFYLGLVSFFTDISSEMIYPLMPIFLTVVLKAPMAFVGVVEGVAESTASILKLVFGWYSDKLGKRKLFTSIGYTISSCVRPLIAFAVYPWHVLAVRFADRVGKGIRTAPRDALIADTCDPEEKGKAFGFNRAMDHAGAVIGPLVASFLLLIFINNYRFVFALSFIPALAAVFIVVFLVRDRYCKNARLVEPVESCYGAKKDYDNKHFLSIHSILQSCNVCPPAFKFYLFVILIFTLGNSSDAFLILRAKEIGVPIALIPILWVLLHIVKMASSTPGGALSDKFGRKKVIVAGWIIYFLVYLGFAFAKNTAQIWVLFAIYGFFFGLTESAEKAFVADLVKPDVRGSAYGVYNFAIGIGALPASVIMGILWQRFGVVTAFSFGAILAVISAFLLLMVKSKR